jgi:hypothetical protein
MLDLNTNINRCALQCLGCDRVHLLSWMRPLPTRKHLLLCRWYSRLPFVRPAASSQPSATRPVNNARTQTINLPCQADASYQ